ncbi:MAG: hypothetical protein ACR2LC_08255 [Pyrinomonadaceae bacterium]
MAELLANYEINRTARWPRVLRFLVGSIVLHTIAVASVIYIPAVRSALSLVNAFRGADYVSEDYTAIDPRDVQILRFGNENGKFQYPPGYFAQNALFTTDPDLIAAKLSPEDYPQAQIVEIYKPEATPKPTPVPRSTPYTATTPTQTQPGALPTATPTTTTAQNTAQPNATPVVSPEKAKADAMEKQAAQLGVKLFPKINKKPFVDLLAEGKRLNDAGEIDLSKPIQLELEADLKADGTLTNLRVVRGPQDKKLLDFALKFVSALSASRALSALDGAESLHLSLTADDKAIAAVASTQFESEQRATEKATGYNLLLGGGQLFKKDEPAATILKSTSVAAKGKQVIVNFRMPRSTAGDIVTKQLASGQNASKNP